MTEHRGDDELWAGFLEWLERSEPMGAVEPILEAFRAHLATDNSPEDADRILSDTLRLMSQRDEVWPILFDRIYSVEEPTFNTEPNAHLAAAVTGVNPGSALDVAMGQGRNAVFLAGLGWKVTGIDVSPVGVATALAAARQAGTEIDAICVDHDEFDFGSDRWDLMVFSYAPVGIARREMVERVTRAMKPGGMVVVETFARRPPPAPVRPVDVDGEEIRQALARFELAFFEEVEEKPDWYETPQPVIRLIALAPTVT